MKMYRGLLFAGWVLASLLAVAGFAAFSASDDGSGGTASAGRVTVATDLGRNAGAVSALAFSFGVEGADPPPPSTVDLDAAVQRAITERAATETTSPQQPGVTRSGTYIRSRYMSEPEVRELVARYFRPEDVNRAIRIAWCESSFNPRSVNPTSGASGLFQHLPRYWAERSAAAGFGGYDIFDPEANVAVAAWLLYEAPGGWSHWVCTA